MSVLTKKFEGLDLDFDKIEIIVRKLMETDETLNPLLDLIEKNLTNWSKAYESCLDTIYRTRLRQMFNGSETEDRMATFSRHLHIAKQIIEPASPTYAVRLDVYEYLLNDALREIQQEPKLDSVRKRNFS